MNICIFGASSDIIDEKYSKAAYELASEMAKRGHGLVFGGGGCGVMGACAQGVYDNNGYILGVAPKFMEQYNVFFKKCTEFKLTDTMAERKTFMEDNSDAFIIAPGGIGTYEEFFEVYTLKQLGRHNKAIAVFNSNGYYDKMVEMLNHNVKENFLRESSLELIKVFDEIEPLLDYTENYKGGEINVKETRYAFLNDIDK
ncbi:MAG: TIGR00730 family Rossman fold protein [Clostridiales bacterium]|nr:TIGR00730 family Rossman fold protein [Clostridiales bacterium]